MNKLSEYLSILLASILTTCGIIKDPLPVGNMICDKSSKEIFYSCLVENIPIGSSYEDLKKFLILHGFGYSINDPDPDRNHEFYFLWDSNNLANYKIGIIGHCNSQLKVIEMKMI